MERYFLQMIQLLRESEEVTLYNNIFSISDIESEAVIKYLFKEYRNEITNYPHAVPEFSGDAALWAAKMIYVVSQLILYRKNAPEELDQLIIGYEGKVSASEVLSADLSLRFLPLMVKELELIDEEDAILQLLNKVLLKWPYSNLDQAVFISEEDLAVVQSNKCLTSMYVNRIIAFKNQTLAEHTYFKPFVNSALGIYKNNFWKELEI